MNSRPYILLACLFLSACGGAESMRESLGLNRKGPDEFQVFERPPLSVPPDFNMRPPGKGSEYSSNVPAEEQAHNKIIGTDNNPAVPAGIRNTLVPSVAATAVPVVSSSELPTSADSQFLANSGADKANSHIREIINSDNETGVTPKNSKYLLDTSKNGDPMVDPTKEAERLKQDKAQNKPPTEGETPVIPQENKGILGNVF